jgi:heme/copper-type cytochrome/quinol oxidase subunit 2
MFRLYAVFFLILCFTFTTSIESNKTLSELNNSNLLYDNKTNKNVLPNIYHQQLLKERLKVIITISSIAIGIMVVIVVAFIAVKYLNSRRRHTSAPTEQIAPLMQ